MKRHQSLIPFSKHHHQALILAQLLQKNYPAFENLPDDPTGKREYFMNQHLELLKYHFEKEEQILFPFIRMHTDKLNLLIDEIIGEHQMMYLLFDKIENFINLENTEDELGKLLASHVRKEERILFEEAQNTLSEARLSELCKLTAIIDTDNNSCNIND